MTEEVNILPNSSPPELNPHNVEKLHHSAGRD